MGYISSGKCEKIEKKKKRRSELSFEIWLLRWNLWCLWTLKFSATRPRNMRSIHLLVALCFALVTGRIYTEESDPANSSSDIYPIITSALQDLPICRSFPICHYVERLRGDRKTRESVVDSTPKYRGKGENGLQARSYYGGYGGSPMAPALYPAIDTVSVLASLAFLAFLLHSFASLFDRSRSIIPSVVSNRQASSGEREIPDPVKLVLRALDEYDILSSNVALEEPRGSGKTTSH